MLHHKTMENARVIKFRLRQGNKIVGYEKAVIERCRENGKQFVWRYSYTNSVPWNTTYIPHDVKEPMFEPELLKTDK